MIQIQQENNTKLQQAKLVSPLQVDLNLGHLITKVLHGRNRKEEVRIFF